MKGEHLKHGDLKVGSADPGRYRERFETYLDILSERLDCCSAVQRLEQEKNLPAPARLYLYGFVPAILDFTDWTLKQAIRTGKQRLYFLSRDGWQMYLTALYLTRKRKLPIECRYLHVSRYCLRLPEYHLDFRQGMDKMCVGGIDVTLERILKRGGLTKEEAEEIAGRMGWQDRYREILNYRQVLELKQTLLGQEKLQEYIKKHSEHAYESTMGYLEQEGLLSDIPYAIVDSGWVGTLQQSLQTLVHSRRPDISVEGYYFGLYELPGEADPDAYHGFYFTPCTGLRRKAHFCNSLFEAVCSAVGGMTVGYIRKENRFVPMMEPSGNPNKEQLQRNQEALREFLACYGGENSQNADQHGSAILERLFAKLMARPAELEVEAFGNNLFSDDVRETSLKRVAAKLTEEEIQNQRFLNRLLIMAGIKKGTIHESAWIEGSIVKCGMQEEESETAVRKNLRHACLYKYIVYGRKQIRSWAAVKRKRNRNKRYAFCWKEGL